MSRQLDDPGFDSSNDEWVGTTASWDRQVSVDASNSGLKGMRSAVNEKAPLISVADFELVCDAIGSGGLTVSFEGCLAQLHRAGHEHLSLQHVAMVAELIEVRTSNRVWTGVPASIKKLARARARQRVAARRRNRR